MKPKHLFSSLLIAGACLAAATAQAQSVLIGKDAWLFYAQDDLTDAGKAGIDNSVQLMRAAQDALQARGIGLVVMVAPLRARFSEDKLPDGTAIAPAARDRYANIIASLRNAGIQTVDLMPVLKSVEHDGQTAFFQKDAHWTAWSAEAAATATADVVRQNWKLGGDAGTGTPLGNWIKERHLSDFSQFMTAAQRKEIGQEIYVVRASQPEAGDLLASAAAPVHVVGNSFVQPYLGYPQALSHALDRRVGLTWKYGNFGPWHMFLEYLESPAFQQARPQVIVWQFNEIQVMYGPNTSGQWDASSLISDANWRSRVQAAVAK
jgi:alginate O-acetyltransferase complex protein AlgJ